MLAVADAVRPETNVVSDKHIAEARSRLIVALDFDRVEDAERLVETLGKEIEFYKVGLGLQLAGGEPFVKKLKEQYKKNVFLDYKYYDIGETIRKAVARAAEFGVDMLTVHGVSQILQSAVAGRNSVAGSKMKIFCVTVLTSLDAEDLKEMGFPETMEVHELVAHRARSAFKAGIDGVIASAQEVGRLKEEFESNLDVITPGIRPLWAASDDQKRIATPFEAISAGADYLVVGRPITGSRNPIDAAHDIVMEMASAIAAG
ncbi:MAG: orotidine-5'-phosphate decarboxylase [Methylocystis sp.]